MSPAAIDRVRNEAWPAFTDPDELYDALMLAGVMTEGEVNGNNPASADGRTWLTGLTEEDRATILRTVKQTLWVCAERLPQVTAVYAGGDGESTQGTQGTDLNPSPTTTTSATPTVIPGACGNPVR